ncbi:FAD-dependent oxidoreductase [Chloroflexota bacterium]
MKAKLIEINPEECTGCRLCELMCSFCHEQECSAAKARIRIVQDEEFGHNLILQCTQCGKAFCVETCPRGAISRDKKTGVVAVDAQVCRACGVCLASCPIEAIHLVGRATPPCELACPIGMDVQGYISLIYAGKYLEAYQLIRKTNPLPAICGRVCHQPCEEVCKRVYLDESLAIRTLKRFATDQVNIDEIEIPQITRNDRKVAIIGSGPAGLTAAHDLALLGYGITIFEAHDEVGGMLRVGIPEYRLPKDVLHDDIKYIEKLGVEIKTGIKVGEQVELKELQRTYEAVLIATGCHGSLKLGIPGEEAPGVLPGFDFLRAVNLGQEVAIGERVVAIGGGNTAIDAARVARRLGAVEVTIVYRRSRQEMMASEEEVKAAEVEGIEFIFLAAPTRVLADNGKVTKLECLRMELREPDASGRRRPVPIKGSEFTIEVDTVIAALGQASDLGFIQKLGLETNKGALVVDGLTLATNAEGLFASGDVVTQATVVKAMASGRKAAHSIDRYLRGWPPAPPKVKEKPQKLSEEEVEQLKREFPAQPRVGMKQLSPLLMHIKGFAEVDQGYTISQAEQEAGRCLCEVGTVFKCDLCGGDPECVKVCNRGVLTVKEVDIDSPERKSFSKETHRLLSEINIAIRSGG